MVALQTRHVPPKKRCVTRLNRAAGFFTLHLAGIALQTVNSFASSVKSHEKRTQRRWAAWFETTDGSRHPVAGGTGEQNGGKSRDEF